MRWHNVKNEILNWFKRRTGQPIVLFLKKVFVDILQFSSKKMWAQILMKFLIVQIIYRQLIISEIEQMMCLCLTSKTIHMSWSMFTVKTFRWVIEIQYQLRVKYKVRVINKVRTGFKVWVRYQISDNQISSIIFGLKNWSLIELNLKNMM